MIPSIPAIPSISAAAGATQSVGAPSGVGATGGPSDFHNILGQAIDSLNGVTNNATNISLQAVAGNATLADATVASTVASLDTQLASALASKAVNALNTIMNMQL